MSFHPDEFTQLIKSIHWFENIGKPIQNPNLPRLRTWDEWGSPENSAISLLHTRQSDLYDAIIAENPSDSTGLAEIFRQAVLMVIEQAKKSVPYDEAEDAYYAPNTAVHQAGYTAGLVVLCQLTGRELPLEIKTQWYWFQEGHWPAAFATINHNHEPQPVDEFVIF